MFQEGKKVPGVGGVGWVEEPGGDCWPEPTSQPGLSALRVRKGLTPGHLLSFWDCHHCSTSSVGGETESPRS